MKNKSYTFKPVALTGILLLLAAGFPASCRRSTEIAEIAVNQSNAANKTPPPEPAKTNKNIEPASTEISEIPTVTYCELIENAARYDKKIVRVRAIYFTAFERTYLYDETCKTDQPPTAPSKVPAQTWAQWDKTLITQSDSIEAKTNRQLYGFGRKDVTVVGRFESTNEQEGKANAPNMFGHLNCCRYQFSIIRLEKIVIMQSEINNRSKEPDKSSAALSDSPTQAYKNAFNARQNKDVEGLKRLLSKKLINFLTENGKLENKTLDEQLKEITERPQAQMALVRDEKIYDDEATLEYLDEDGKWIEMSFVKEAGEWKLTLPGEQL
jgi:hypothetical protein